MPIEKVAVQKKERSILILFAKAPEPGEVKTRLQPLLSKEEAAALQEALILDTLVSTRSLPVQRALACAPTIHHPFFARRRKEESLFLIEQEGRDLGSRMKNAFKWGFAQGFEKVVLIGCDAPTLPFGFIQEAFERLDSFHVTLGPSRDGGYYLIGARPPLPDLFDGVDWGTDRVLTATLRRWNKRGEPLHLLPFWYDIDRPEDLLFLKEHLLVLERQGKPAPKETRRVIRSLPLGKALQKGGER